MTISAWISSARLGRVKRVPHARPYVFGEQLEILRVAFDPEEALGRLLHLQRIMPLLAYEGEPFPDSWLAKVGPCREGLGRGEVYAPKQIGDGSAGYPG